MTTGNSPETAGVVGTTANVPLSLRFKLWHDRMTYRITSRLSRFLLDLAFRIGDRESKLVKHAESELRRAGMYDADADYDGMLPQAVMDLVRVHSMQGHSGFSHEYTLALFNKVVNYQVLMPITDDPDEWTDNSAFAGRPSWQNKRQFSCFSEDGGKTYRDNNERPIHQDETGETYTKSIDEAPLHTSKPHKGNVDGQPG